MACYVRISEKENAEEIIEVPTEDDGNMLLSSLAAQFPNAVGLRFKTESGAFRGCRVEGNIIDPPLDGWGDREYYVVTKKVLKRGIDDDDDGPLGKLNKMTEEDILSDLMAAGLPFSATDKEVREHFESFGELESFSIMHDQNGRSRGFGFLRFKTVEGVEAALRGTHLIKNRRYELNYSKRSRGGEVTNEVPTKLFIGRLPQGTTTSDLQEYFCSYGVLKDVYIPTPFRGYAFVLFGSEAIANKVLSESHTIKGVVVNVGIPSEKKTGKKGVSGQSNQGFGNMQGGMQDNGNQMGNRQSNMLSGMNNNPWVPGKMQNNGPSSMNNTQPWMQGKMQNNAGDMNNKQPWMQGKLQNNTSGMNNNQPWAQGKMQNNVPGSLNNNQPWMQGKMQNNTSGINNSQPWMQGKMQNNTSGMNNNQPWMQGKMQNSTSSTNNQPWMQGKMQNSTTSTNNQPWMQGKMQTSMPGGMNNNQPWMQGNTQNNTSGMNTQPWMQGNMSNNTSDANTNSMMQGKTQTQNGDTNTAPRSGYGYQGNGNYIWPVSQ